MVKQLILNPTIALGPLVFDSPRDEIWQIMKKEFNCKAQDWDAESEYYEEYDLEFEYYNDRLIALTTNCDAGEHFVEVWWHNRKIWPATFGDFFTDFKIQDFVDVCGTIYNPNLSLAVEFDHEFSTIILGNRNYCAEIVENFKLSEAMEKLAVGMSRDEVRQQLNFEYRRCDDQRMDCYAQGLYLPEETFLTYDPQDKLTEVVKRFPNGKTYSILK